MSPENVTGSNASNDMPELLLVDDDLDTLEEMKSLIEANGIACICAGNALDALLAFQKHPSIRLLVADFDMPAFNGLDLVEKATQQDTERDLAAIIVSGKATLDTALRALRYDVVDFLLKPVRPLELLAAIERARSRLGERVRQPVHTGAKPNLVNFFLKVQKANFGQLNGHRLVDPTWAVVLDLLRAEQSGKHRSLTNIGLDANASSSTLLRRVQELINGGILDRVEDPADGRRSYVTFTAAGRAQVKEILQQLEEAIDVPDPEVRRAK